VPQEGQDTNWGCLIRGILPRLGASSRRVAAELDFPRIAQGYLESRSGRQADCRPAFFPGVHSAHRSLEKTSSGPPASSAGP